jgi:hypothetical protein
VVRSAQARRHTTALRIAHSTSSLIPRAIRDGVPCPATAAPQDFLRAYESRAEYFLGAVVTTKNSDGSHAPFQVQSKRPLGFVLAHTAA